MEKESRSETSLSILALKEAGLCLSSAFYAPRPEGNGDLGNAAFEKIYDVVRVGQGSDAAKNYVQMVAGLTFVTQHVTGKTFLDSFYNLEKNGWKYAPEILSEYDQARDQITKSRLPENPKYNPKAALEPSPAMREQMVGNFLVNHEAEIDDSEQVEKLHQMSGWRIRQRDKNRIG